MAPVIFSHSTVRRCATTPQRARRCRSLVANGGVCMVTFVPEFILPRRPPGARGRGQQRGVQERTPGTGRRSAGSAQAAEGERPDATIQQVVAHLEHVVKVAGIDHVGIGCDYDGTDTFRRARGRQRLPPVPVAALLERSWSEADVAQLVRGNTLRVMRDVEAWPETSRRPGPRAFRRFAELDG